VRNLTEKTSCRLRSSLVAILRISTEGRKKTTGPVDRVGNFVGYRLVERDRACVALNGVVRLVTAL
jgi:hypothetical protein